MCIFNIINITNKISVLKSSMGLYLLISCLDNNQSNRSINLLPIHKLKAKKKGRKSEIKSSEKAIIPKEKILSALQFSDLDDSLINTSSEDESLISDYQEKYHQYQNKYHQLKKRIEKIHDQKEDLKHIARQERLRYVQKRIKYHKQKKEYSKLQDKLNLIYEVGDDKYEHNLIDKQLEAKNKTIVKLKNQLSNDISEYKKENKHLKKQIRKEQNENQTLTDKVAEEQTKNNLLTGQIETLIKKNKAREKYITELENTGNNTDIIQMLKTNIKVLKEENKKLQQQIIKTLDKTKYVSQEKQLEINNTEFPQNLQTQIQELNTKNDKLQTNINKLKDKNQLLQIKLQKAEEISKEKIKKLDENKCENTISKKTQEELKNLKQITKTLKGQNEELQNEIEQLKQQLNKKKHALHNEMAALKKTTAKYKLLRKSLLLVMALGSIIGLGIIFYALSLGKARPCTQENISNSNTTTKTTSRTKSDKCKI